MCLWENDKPNQNVSLGGAQILCKIFQAEGVRCDLNWLLYGENLPPESQNKINDLTLENFQKEICKLMKGTHFWQVKNNNLSPIYEVGNIVFFEEINKLSMSCDNIYLTIDFEQKKRLSFVHIIKNKTILYSNNPTETIEANIIKAFRPIASA